MKAPISFPVSRKTMTAFGVIALCFVGFQNCGEFQANKLDLLSTASLGSNALTMNACMQTDLYDACVFAKGTSPLTADPSSVGDSPAFGVDLSAMTSENKLENENFVVLTQAQPSQNALSEALSASNAKFKFGLSDSEGQLKSAMVSSFYWANHALSIAQQAGQTAPASAGRKIKLVLNPSINGWAPAKNQIHLSFDGPNSMAFDPSITVYYFGWANIDYATAGKIHQVTQPKHIQCGGGANCCASALGCGRALASAHAEYLVGMSFPQNPAVGDRVSGLPGGAPICSSLLSRSPASLASASAADAAKACESDGQPNSIYSLGSLYASIWWTIRSSAVTDDATVDRLHMKLVSQLDGDDDFLTALDKLKSIDQAEFNSEFGAFFESEYRSRGLL